MSAKDKNGVELEVGDRVDFLKYEYPWVITEINGNKATIDGGDFYLATVTCNELALIPKP